MKTRLVDIEETATTEVIDSHGYARTVVVTETAGSYCGHDWRVTCDDDNAAAWRRVLNALVKARIERIDATQDAHA